MAGAEKQYRDSLAWREKNGVDSLKREDMSALQYNNHYDVSTVFGYAKDGTPLLWQSPAAEDFVGRNRECGEGTLIYIYFLLCSALSLLSCVYLASLFHCFFFYLSATVYPSNTALFVAVL